MPSFTVMQPRLRGAGPTVDIEIGFQKFGGWGTSV